MQDIIKIIKRRLRRKQESTLRRLSLNIPIGIFAIILPIITLLTVLSVSPAHADTNVSGNNKSKVSVTITDSLALRLLDKTASTEISSLNLALDLYPQGALTYDSMLAEVDTSNATGYKLYINSDYQDSTSSYTTSLTNLDSTIAEKSHGRIPTLSNPSAPTDLSFTITEAEYSIPNSAYRNTWGYSTNKLGIVRTVDEETSEVTNTITTNTDTSTVLYRPMPAKDNSISITESREPIIKHLTPITIGVNASAGTAAGTYRNKVALTAVANPLTIDYSLSFNGNTDGAGHNDGTATNLPETMTKTSVASQEEFVIPSTVPTRSGYVFMGWSEDPSINSGSGSGTDGLYVAGDTYTLIADDSLDNPGQKTLYARWELVNFYNITYMQDMTPSICSSATTPSTSATTSDTTGAYKGNTNYVPETTLIDYRGTDGTGTASSPATGSNIRSYTVRKLADGNCWMSDNLKLTLSTSHSYEVGTFDGETASWTPNSGSGDAYNVAINANTIANDSTTGEWYYPWYAATAGQGTRAFNPTISRSICPKGWKLPNGGANAAPSFKSIVDTYSATTANEIKAAPLSYTAVGDYRSGSPSSTSAGLYWSASPYTSDNNYAYILIFGSIVNPQNYNYKYYGFSVRCVAIP